MRQARPGPVSRHRRRTHRPAAPPAPASGCPLARGAIPAGAAPADRATRPAPLASGAGSAPIAPMPSCAGDERIGLVRLQGDPLEAEIRLQPLQHLREQPPQMRRRPRRQAGADRQLLHVAVHPERPQCHLPGAPTRLCQNLTKLIEQPIHRPVDAGTGDDRVDEVARHAELRRRTYRDHRSPPVARDRIQRVQQHPAEAPGQWRTGLAQHVADALQAQAGAAQPGSQAAAAASTAAGARPARALLPGRHDKARAARRGPAPPRRLRCPR